MISDNFIYIQPRPGESRITLADNSKAKIELGWEPKVELSKWLNNR